MKAVNLYAAEGTETISLRLTVAEAGRLASALQLVPNHGNAMLACRLLREQVAKHNKRIEARVLSGKCPHQAIVDELPLPSASPYSHLGAKAMAELSAAAEQMRLAEKRDRLIRAYGGCPGGGKSVATDMHITATEIREARARWGF